MASEWHFYSLDMASFQSLSGQGDGVQQEALTRTLSNPGFFDCGEPEQVRAIARIAYEEGLSYENRVDDEVDVLDCLVAAAIKLTPDVSYLRQKPVASNLSSTSPQRNLHLPCPGAFEDSHPGARI